MAFWAKLAAKKHGIPFVSSTTTFAFNRFSAKVIEQNGAGFLQFLLAQPRINRQLKRLRAAGYAVKSVFDIIANDNETETVVYTSPDFQPCADTFFGKIPLRRSLLRPAQSSFEKAAGALPPPSRSARSTTTRSPSTVPALPPSAARSRAFSSCSPPARRQTCGARSHSGKLHRPRERGPDMAGARLRRRLSHPLRHEQRERDCGTVCRSSSTRRRRTAWRTASALARDLRRRHPPPRGRAALTCARPTASARCSARPGSRHHRARGELSDSMQKHAPADSGSVFLYYVNSYFLLAVVVHDAREQLAGGRRRDGDGVRAPRGWSLKCSPPSARRVAMMAACGYCSRMWRTMLAVSAAPET